LASLHEVNLRQYAESKLNKRVGLPASHFRAILSLIRINSQGFVVQTPCFVQEIAYEFSHNT